MPNSNTIYDFLILKNKDKILGLQMHIVQSNTFIMFMDEYTWFSYQCVWCANFKIHDTELKYFNCVSMKHVKNPNRYALP